MACCTTIPPLNNPSQKRKSGGIFDMPRSAKQRRSLANTLVKTSPHLTSSSQSSTMFTTTSSLQNKSIFIETDSDKSKTSVFQTNSPYSPLNSLRNQDIDATANSDENQFKNELMERIRHEAKRLIKRKQLTISPTTTTNLETLSTSCTDLTDSPKSPESTTKKNLLSHNDMPIFSMNQVNTICERMLGERETAIREQYDKILSQKMNEQYDAFVKFTHEQIQRRFESSQCSYVS